MGLVLLLTLTGLLFVGPASGSPAGPAAPGTYLGPDLGVITPLASTPYNTTLSVSNVSVNLSSQFFGTTINNEVRMFRGEPDSVNATPAHVLVWPGAMAGEDYDPFTNVHYNTYDGIPTTALTSEVQFVQMCEAIHCTAIVQVPAEIDDAAFAESIVNYTEVNLSFHPAYWMIGNEPELWSHWQVPWKNWGSDYTNGPNPTQFGNEVVAYVNDIRKVDNTTPILGLPASGCTCGSYTFEQWISGVLKVTGSKIQAVAFHEYPAGWLGTGDGSLLDFYATIQTTAGIPQRMIGARAAVQSACPGCNVSVFISELGAALSWSAYGQYAIGFSGPLSIASQITQAMDDNLSNIDLFAAELNTTNSWFSPQGHVRADYALYTQIFDHLGTQAFPVNFTGLGKSIYGIDTIAPGADGRRDLLVVNDNITKSITFTPQFAELAGTEATEAWYWNGSIHTTAGNATTWVEPYTPNPVPQQYPGGLPSRYTIPPQSMVLFESYPFNASFVRVNESGVPLPTPWYVSVGDQSYTTSGANFSLLLPAGSYPTGSVGIPLPIGGKEYNPTERLGPFVPNPAEVRGASTNLTVTYVDQWKVDLTASPGVGGTVWPNETWWNDSQPLNVTARPATGYSFDRWSGWGNGSYNGTGRTITIDPKSRLVETAKFAAGFEVDLLSAGLPTGTEWSVTVHGFTTYSNSTLLILYEPTGRYGYQVAPIPGYRILPANGSFYVGSDYSTVSIRFVPITPPGVLYPVQFRVSGLPGGTTVPITIRGATLVAGAAEPIFDLLNGNYAYTVGYVPGYHVGVPDKTFAVRSGPAAVTVPFVPTMYTAIWNVTGTRPGLNWSLVLNGNLMAANASWLSASLPNGTYSYSIDVPVNFSATPRTGVVNISGSSLRMPVSFSLLEFAAVFQAAGLAASSGWSVRLGNATLGASSNGSSFMAPNGTYTYDIHPPTGYYAVPSHGNLTVAGPTPALLIRFFPTSEKPSAALVAALSAGALTISAWIGGACAVGYACLRAARRRGG